MIGAVLFAATNVNLAMADTAGAAATQITVPGGTALAFQVSGDLSSGTANVGDTFGIRTLKDVVVDGFIVVAKGSEGLGEVMKVDHAGSNGHAGSLGLQLDWVYAVDGNKIKLTSEQKTAEGENHKGQASTVTIISTLFLWPGLFAHNFVKGSEVQLTPENTIQHPLTAFVDTSVYVMAQTKAVQSNFAPNAPSNFAPPATRSPAPNSQ
jgi:hypothetical protein